MRDALNNIRLAFVQIKGAAAADDADDGDDDDDDDDDGDDDDEGDDDSDGDAATG
jgi:hypothetical protein